MKASLISILTPAGLVLTNTVLVTTYKSLPESDRNSVIASPEIKKSEKTKRGSKSDIIERILRKVDRYPNGWGKDPKLILESISDEAYERAYNHFAGMMKTTDTFFGNEKNLEYQSNVVAFINAEGLTSGPFRDIRNLNNLRLNSSNISDDNLRQAFVNNTYFAIAYMGHADRMREFLNADPKYKKYLDEDVNLDLFD